MQALLNRQILLLRWNYFFLTLIIPVYWTTGYAALKLCMQIKGKESYGFL